MATALSSETLHASCVAIEGRAVLITGPSGSGKSDLALRLIDRGATLISDDYTIVRRAKDQLLALPPARIMGMIEVRGLGLISMPHVAEVPVALVVMLDGPVERMPQADVQQQVVGISVPVMAVAAFEASSPLKVELALKRLTL